MSSAMFPPPPPRMSQILSRSSSAASVSSAGTVCSMDDDASMSGLTAMCHPMALIDRDEPPRRTRKRFSSTQLMMLEHLYHQTSHPTREQREILARQVNIELRSVTVWFQNKRQTERKVALSGVAVTSASAPHLSTLDAHMHSLGDGRALQRASHSRRLSGTSQTRSSHSPTLSISPTISSSGSSTRTVRTHAQSHAPPHHVKPATSSHGRPTLDHVASRAERSHPRTPTRLSCSLPTLDLSRGAGGLDDIAALWANMPSSPLSPSDSPSSCDRDRELLDFSKTLGRRHLTLEYACAAARVLGRNVEEDEDVLPQLAMEIDEDVNDSERMLEMDTGGDTEDDGEHEAVTPQSSQDSVGSRRKRSRSSLWAGKKMSATEGIHVQDRDADVMNAAIALCGLAGF